MLTVETTADLLPVVTKAVAHQRVVDQKAAVVVQLICEEVDHVHAPSH